MKKFLIKFNIFILAWVFLIFCVEYYLINFQSTFKVKHDFINKERQEIEILALGSSHIQNGINPEFVSNYQMANLAFGGQGVNLDHKLLEKYLYSLPNLKYVILELGYQSLEKSNELNYHRNSLYLRFYNINNYGRDLSLKDYSIFLSKPKLYATFFNPFRNKSNINKFGNQVYIQLSDDRFRSLEYDEKFIKNDSNNIFIKRHKYEDIETFNNNIRVFEEMLVLCNERNVIPIIIIPPVYDSYYRQMIRAKKLRRDNFIAEMKNKYLKLQVLNFEQDDRFSVADFKNEDHLNPIGGEKFSKILNDTLCNLEFNTYKSINVLD